MTFREILEHVVGQTPGALAGAIMGTDGISVEEWATEASEVELSTLTIEFSGVFEQLRKASGSLYGEGSDALEEVIVTTREHVLLFRPIDEEYLFVVALEPLGMVGKARYLVRSVMDELRQEL